MVKIVATSEFANFLDFGRLEDFLFGKTAQYEGLLDGFGDFLEFGNFTPTSLTSTKFVFNGSYGSYNFQMSVSGSGIGPVSSLAALEAAFEAGLATGQFDSITVQGTKTPAYVGDNWIPASTFLNFKLGDSGYTLISGNVRVIVSGDLPTSMDEFFDIYSLADQLAQFENLTEVQQNALIASLNDYDMDAITLKIDGETVFKLAASPTKISLELLGYEMSIVGTFPDGIGNSLATLMQMADALDSNAVIDLTNFAGTSLSRILIKNPDGEVVLKTVGTPGNTANTTIESVRLDGSPARNLDGGDNTENRISSFLDPDRGPYVPGDTFFGTDRADQFFGLGGNDTLNGGKGNDTLFGGSGNDTIDGGNGDDVINSGSNMSGDTILGSRGNDTIIFSDNGDYGYQSLSYANLTRGISANINAANNTGTVNKGGQGKDTLIDVLETMDDAMFSWTKGFGIVGTQFDDKFRMVNTTNDWANIIGGGGADSYNLLVKKGSVIRLDFFGFQGVEVNLSSGVIANDGYGNVEMVTVYNRGGQISIQSSNMNDTLIGSNFDDRFILGAGNDFADGLGGTDMVRYDRYGVTAVEVDLEAGTATGVWNGQAFSHQLQNIENIRGSRDDDDELIGNGADNRIQGRGGDDIIDGNDGRDWLFGEAGDDDLNGGRGNDILVGGIGNDFLAGRAGRDQFRFNADEFEGTDTIVDFQDGKDLMRIEGATLAELRLSTETGAGGDVAIVQLASGTVIRVEDTHHTDLTASDFIFV